MCDTPCHIVMATLDRKSFLRASVRTYKHFSPCVWNSDKGSMRACVQKSSCLHAGRMPDVSLQRFDWLGHLERSDDMIPYVCIHENVQSFP